MFRILPSPFTPGWYVLVYREHAQAKMEVVSEIDPGTAQSGGELVEVLS